MEKFYGFDLGDAESAVSLLHRDDQTAPEIIEIAGAGSFITAYALLKDGRRILGEKACYEADAVERKLRFKSRFLTDPSCDGDIRNFAGTVLTELYRNGDLVKDDDCCFYVGCPAGWDKNTRERYRSIFERLGYPPLKIVSESRAALVSACQSRYLQVGYDILSKPVLVVDIGSSTTDFAYIMSGREVEMQTAGEVSLGGGIMDEILLEEAVESSLFKGRIRSVFKQSEPWRTYCEFAARHLKEKYFSDEEYFKDHPCKETVLIRYREPLRLSISMDGQTADKLMNKKTAKLGGRSFHQVFTQSLTDVRENINGQIPELIFLTGGVSKLKAIRDWCLEVFPESIVITGVEPEYSVSRGLAWSGRIDEELHEFHQEIDEFLNSSKVEEIIGERIRDLYKSSINALVHPILEKVALPVFERWKSGEIRRLSDTDKELEKGVEEYLHTDDARDVLSGPITSWLRGVSTALEEYTVPICVRHNVPYSALSLSSLLSASDIDIKIEAKDMFAVEEITWLIDSIITILVGLICGGGGAALISSGPTGIMAGVLISMLVLVLGKDKMESALLNADIPNPVRKLVPRSSFKSRMDSMTGEIIDKFNESIDDEKNREITGRMVSGISDQIEICLTKMAEVVEIPLG